MLRYAKQILQKVSFDLALFEKELRKCISYLSGEELDQFKDWCYQTFMVPAYRLVLNRYFNKMPKMAF